MITIDKIRNGDQAEEVREKINNNFEKLSKNSSSDIMALSTEERLAMSNEYLRDGLIVFDITLQTCLSASAMNGYYTHFIRDTDGNLLFRIGQIVCLCIYPMQHTEQMQTV